MLLIRLRSRFTFINSIQLCLSLKRLKSIRNIIIYLLIKGLRFGLVLLTLFQEPEG